MSLIKSIINSYNEIPLGILNAMAPFYHLLPKTIRYTDIYRKEKSRIDGISLLSAEQIKINEDEMLRKLIQYSYKHVEYYRDMFVRIGLKPDDITCVDDLGKIPFLTKELLIRNQDKLISDEFSKDDLVYITTSGSTGTPTGFYVQKDSHFRDLAYVSNMFSSLGYGINSSRLILRGKKFISLEKGKAWQWDAFKRELSINIFDMSDENMELYCRAIEKYKPDFAYGYMSAMYFLCKYICRRQGGLNHKFKAFISISEMVLEEQKSFVEKTINAPVKTFYGMSERVIMAVEKDNQYKIMPMYGIAEIVDNDGLVIKKTNVIGGIVGTSLLNYGMPLIRYKMDDLSSWSGNDLLYGNGKEGRVLSMIQGRNKKDVLINIDKQVVSLASMEVHSVIYSYMERYQFVQSEIGKVQIKVVLHPSYKKNRGKLNEIKKVFTDRTQGKIIFEIIEVNEIATKKNGKFSMIIQNLNVDEF